MASKETLGRVRHMKLSTQQHRLRHLRSISARNIVIKLPIHGDSLVDSLLETYFTLHTDSNSKAIYTSERIPNSLNPTWSSFEPTTLGQNLETATSSFVVRVWGGQGGRFYLLIEWSVDLSGLKYLGEQIRTSHHKPNTLLFGLVDGYYGANPDNDVPSYAPGLAAGKDVIKVDTDQVVETYNRSSLLRLCTLQKAIRQTEISVLNVRQMIEDKLQTTEKSLQQMAERESLKLRVKLLREELIHKHATIHKEREEERKYLERVRKRERGLERKQAELNGLRNSLQQHKKDHVDKRENLVKLKAQLNIRRRQLASELTHIYPIIELPSKEMLICSVRLANSESEEFYATDDETLSCSLGYACHLVHMISKVLELPLRYTMHPMGSRSTIMDFTIDKVADRDKEFPLHTKGKEKIHFFYGVFLLNKNIAQLRQCCGLGTPNLRNTLPNIKELLATKFRASADPTSMTTRPSSLKSGSLTSSNDSKIHPSENDVITSNKRTVIKPTPTESVVTKPIPAEGAVTKQTSTESAVTQPEPTESTVTKQITTESVVTKQTPIESAVTMPAPTESVVTMPAPTESVVTMPAPTESVVTTATPTEIAVTKPLLPPKPSGLVSPPHASTKSGSFCSVDGNESANAEQSHPGKVRGGSKPPLPPKPQDLHPGSKEGSPVKVRTSSFEDNVGNVRSDAKHKDSMNSKEQLRQNFPQAGTQDDFEIIDDSEKLRIPSKDGELKAPSQGAPHKFLGKFSRKSGKTGSAPVPSGGPKPDGHRPSATITSRDIRGFPVEVLRRMAATGHVTSKDDTAGSTMANSSEQRHTRSSSQPPTACVAGDVQETTGNPQSPCDQAEHYTTNTNMDENSEQFDIPSNGEIDLR
ncbi:uncharacterized protein LOC5506616 [Nematostella vectensis]|uniref:uncharacterized protein LOC5506616 n=1 Tax=Nematostella vectensis TaxID=45351 RepID=UPI0020770632|nr:uncharacterized protein LOC5506616 [Nematostella vectensis]